ncbi:hypothetical protein GQ600_3296 [Phytophthora cactorum]|nr:hypothetical protein GQ600_3296 [Phytophthora cactorum]
MTSRLSSRRTPVDCEKRNRHRSLGRGDRYFGYFATVFPLVAPIPSQSRYPVFIGLCPSYNAPDVVHNSGVGVEAMMRSWRRLSNWFEDAELELDRWRKVLMDPSSPLRSLVSL